MDKQKVLEIAREVYPNAPIICLIGEDDLMRFAKAINAATREECANDLDVMAEDYFKLAEDPICTDKGRDIHQAMAMGISNGAAAIRNMGKEG